MTKIKCNAENKSTIINNLNECVNTLTNINNAFYNTYIPYDFYYKNNLNNIKNDLISSKNKLNNYKNNLNKFIEEINEEELEILSKLNKIEDIMIEKF